MTRLLGIWTVYFALVFALALILAGCASTRTGRALNVAVLGSGIADVASTRYAMAHGAREMNPLMGQSLRQQIAVKGLGIGTVIGLAHLLETKGHPVLAQISRSIAISVWSAVSVRNVWVGHVAHGGR